MQCHTSRRTAALAAVIAAAIPAAAQVEAPRVIFSNLASSPTSDVPGMSGVKFNPGSANQFDRPFGSPNGQRWILGATTNLLSTINEIVIVGGGTSGTGATVVLQEGTVTFFDAGAAYGVLDPVMGINDAGSFAFTSDTTVSSTTDEIVARYTAGGGFELIAREGTQAVGQAAGVGYGSTSNAAHILNDAGNTTAFRSSSFTNATTQQALFRNTAINVGVVVAQTDVTTPCNQLVAPNQSIDAFTNDRFRMDASGSNFIYHADLNGPTATDLVMVVNGCVVAQEGVPLPNSAFLEPVLTLSSDSGSQQIAPGGGQHLFRGSNADSNVDWVVRNGTVIAATGQPIKPGSEELYDDTNFSNTFFVNTPNSRGDYVIGGATNALDQAANTVLMLNGRIEIARRGDAVDVDGDGNPEPDVRIGSFNNDDSFLTADRKYFFVADLRDSALTTIGQAFMWIQLPLPADANCDGSIDFFDIDPFLAALFNDPQYSQNYPDCDPSQGDVNGDGSVDFFDIDPFLSVLFG